MNKAAQAQSRPTKSGQREGMFCSLITNSEAASADTTRCPVSRGRSASGGCRGGQRRSTQSRERAWLEPGRPKLPAHPGSLLQARRPLSPACKGPSLNISRSRKLTSKPGVSQSQGEQPTAASTCRSQFVSPAGLGPISFKTEIHLPDVQSIEVGQRSPDPGSRCVCGRGAQRKENRRRQGTKGHGV